MNKSNKQKKLLLKLEKEIKELEARIKHLKIEKAKANAIRSLKISLKLYPYILPFLTYPLQKFSINFIKRSAVIHSLEWIAPL